MTGPITLEVIKENGTTLDLMPYLADTAENDVEVTLERERGRFEFVCSDLRVRLSNLDRTLETFFQALRKSSAWKVQLTVAGRRLFNGWVEPQAVEVEKMTEWLTLTALSATRKMYDRLESSYVRKVRWPWPYGNTADGIGPYWVFYQELLQNHLAGTGIATGPLTVANEYMLRRMNYGYDGNRMPWPNGLLQDMAQGVTWAELLRQMALYYNAVIYVDPETNGLTMTRRTATTGTHHNLDGRLLESAEPTVRMVDAEAIDYAHTYMQANLNGPFRTGPYDVANIYAGNDYAILGSQHVVHYLMVYFEGDTPLFISNMTTWQGPALLPGFYVNRIEISLPQGPDNITMRRVYRLQTHGSDGIFRQIVEVGDNVGNTIHQDTMQVRTWRNQNRLDFTVANLRGAYMRYNEATGSWDPVIWESSTQPAPTGTILDVRPQLRFNARGSWTQEAPDNPYDEFTFFGRELDTGVFHAQYRDLFETKREITIRVSGTNYREGDTARFDVDQVLSRYGTMTVKRARLWPLRDQAELTLIGETI